MTLYDKELLADNLRRRAYKQETPNPADDARKLLEAGVQPTGRGWCSLFAASAVSVLALVALLAKVLL